MCIYVYIYTYISDIYVYQILECREVVTSRERLSELVDIYSM